MAINVKPHTLPEAGIDHIEITIEETYNVEGIGKDTVTLKGRLVADRTVPLLGHGTRQSDWKTSTVVARFTDLNVTGNSKIFGPVHVTLDHSVPSFGVVRAGACAAAIGVHVGLPQHGLTLRSASPVQLHSEVQTVPPIGDEKTESVLPVELVDVASNRPRGSLEHVRVAWRELVDQTRHGVK
jgi:hypothetical protein